MNPNYHLYLAYSQNQYDEQNETYFPISQEELDEIKDNKLVGDSLIFDMNRHTIYAKGKEFGGLNAVFQKVSAGEYDDNKTNILLENTYFVTSVNQDQYGQISYTYSTAYVPIQFGNGVMVNDRPGTYVTSAFMNALGEITYTYAMVHHTTYQGTLSASIYDVRNNVTSEIIVDDPKRIVLGDDIAIIEEASGSINVYDTTSGDMFLTNINGNDIPDNIYSNKYNDIIFIDDAKISILDGTYGDWHKLDTDKPVLGVTIQDDILSVQFRRYTNLELFRRIDDNGAVEFISLGETTFKDNIKVTTNAIYYTLTTASRPSRYSINKIDITRKAIDDKTTILASTTASSISNYAIEYGNLHKEYNDEYYSNRFAYLSGTNIYVGGIRDINANLPTGMINPGMLRLSRPGGLTFDCRYISLIDYQKLYIFDSEDAGSSHDIGPIKGGEKLDPIVTNKYYSISNVKKAIVNNDSMFCVLDIYGNVSLYTYGENYEVNLVRPNILTNVSDLVEFEFTDSKAYVKAIHIAETAIIDYVYLDPQGNLMYHQHDASMGSGEFDDNYTITNSISVDVVTGITQSANGQVAYAWSTINTTHATIAPPPAIFGSIGNWPFSISYINLDEDGNLTYDVRDLSTKYNDSNYQNLTYTNGEKLANATDPASSGTYTKVLTNIVQDSVGHISYTYAALYTDPRDYKYHTFSITQNTIQQNNDDWGYALVGMSTGTASAESHVVSYVTKAFVTKNYVDNTIETSIEDAFRTNDALRYVGTVSATLVQNGQVSFSMNSDQHPFERGAVYKVSNAGYFGTQWVSPGDMIISNNDLASSTDFSFWDVINENLNLRTLDTSLLPIGNKILTYVHLTGDGTFSYTYNELNVSSEKEYNAKEALNQTGIYNLSNVENGARALQVVTGVSIVQDGLDIKFSYSYAYVYSNQNHHGSSSSLPGQQYVVTDVNLTSNGTLQYNKTSIATPDPESSEDLTLTYYKEDVITEIYQDGNGKIHPTKKTLYVQNERVKTLASTTSKIYINGNLGNGRNEQFMSNVSYAYSDAISYIKNGILYSNNLQGSSSVSTPTLNAQQGNISNIDGDFLQVDQGIIDILGVRNELTIGRDSCNIILPHKSSSIDFTSIKALWGIVGA